MIKKKIIGLVLLAAFLLGFSANAKFGIGPIAGVNINKLSASSEKIFDSANRAGFNIGVTGEYIVPFIGIGADISLMYAWQESKADYNGVNQSVKSSFLQIPLHVKYKLSLAGIGKIFAPYIYTGPDVAVKLGGSNDYFKTKSAQWGWDLGIGLQFIEHLQIGAGYTWGINNIVSKMNIPTTQTDNIKVKNNYWTVTACWMF